MLLFLLSVVVVLVAVAAVVVVLIVVVVVAGSIYQGLIKHQEVGSTHVMKVEEEEKNPAYTGDTESLD